MGQKAKTPQTTPEIKEMCSAQPEKPAKTKCIESQCNCRNKKVFGIAIRIRLPECKRYSFIIVGHAKGSTTDPVLCLVPTSLLGCSWNWPLR